MYYCDRASHIYVWELSIFNKMIFFSSFEDGN